MSLNLRDCTALIIDPNPTSRSVLGAQLRDIGLRLVVQTGSVLDARKRLEVRGYDVVLCEMDFQINRKRGQTGHELLDECRKANLLSWSTVFIMVTGERRYSKVAEAAESALDCYLLKPFSTMALEERVLMARKRKFALQDIYTAIENGLFEEAAGLCTQRFHSRGNYWLYAARLGIELYLRLEMHASATELLEAVLAHQALPWARLGIARAQLAQGQVTPAMRTLESLLIDEPTFVDAYDVLGRTQLAQGNLAQAMDTFKQAADLTPGAVRRQQKLGMLAFYSGKTTEAGEALEKATIIGQNSKIFDYQTLVLLAIVRFQQRDSKGLGRCVTDIARALEKAPESTRLLRFSLIITAFELRLNRETTPCYQALVRLAADIDKPNFDFEAGCNLLTALTQLRVAGLEAPEASSWIERTAKRFTGVKGVTELLASAASPHPPYADLIKAGHQAINSAAEKAMLHSIAGRPDTAIEHLLEHARLTLNQKFVETAKGVMNRYGDKLKAAAKHQATLETLKPLMGSNAHVGSLLGRSEENLGGIKLRGAEEVLRETGPVAVAVAESGAA